MSNKKSSATRQTLLPESLRVQAESLLFFLLLFGYPLVSFAWRRAYPLTSPDLLSLLALAGLAALLLSIVLTNVRPGLIRLLTAALVTLVLMVQFNLLLVGVALCLVTSLALTWALKDRFRQFGVVVLLALMVGAFLDGQQDRRGAGKRLHTAPALSQAAPVVHILLDGFVGLDGLPEHPDATPLRREILAFFRTWGFRVYPRAYSRYAATGDSLYSALNFRSDGESTYGLEVSNRSSHSMKANAEFQVFQEQGYVISVYQTDFLDLCQTNTEALARCWNYPQPNVKTLIAVADFRLRVRMLASVLLHQSAVLTHVLKDRGWLNGLGIAVHDPEAFERLQADLHSEPFGRLFFAHVLLPHGPFAFDRGCNVTYDTPAWARYAGRDGEVNIPGRVLELRQQLYFGQIRCALVSLDRLFEGMKRDGIFDDATIILHGDHGSLIAPVPPNYYNRERLAPADYRAHFSTLFALKLTHGEFGINSEVLGLEALLAAVASEISASGGETRNIDRWLEPAGQPYVFLSGSYPLLRVDINIFEDVPPAR